MSGTQRRTTSTAGSAATPIPRITPPQQGYTEVARSVFDRLRQGVRRSSSNNTTAEQLAAKSTTIKKYVSTARQDASYKTSSRIRALDINQARTHVVLAGGKILKIVRVDEHPTEDFDLRTAAVNPPWKSNTERDQDANATYKQEILDPAALDRETFDIEDVAWSNNEFKDFIATAARNGKIMLYNIRRPGMEIARLHEHVRQVHKVDFNHLEGGVLLSGSQDGTVRLWDLRSLQRSAMLCSSKDMFNGRSQGVRHVKWSRTSTWTFAFCTDDGTIQRWDTRVNKKPVFKFFAHEGNCNSVDWHPDGRHLVSGGQDGMVKVWDMGSDEHRSKDTVTSLRAPYGVQNVRWRPPCNISDGSDGEFKQCTHLATSYKEYPIVHVWDLRTPYIPFREVYHTHNDGTTDMLWRDRDLLWTVGRGGEFMQTDVPYAPKTIERRPLSTFAISASGEMNLLILKRSLYRVPTKGSEPQTTLPESGTKPQSMNKPAGLTGRSPGGDSVDERFLGVPNRRRRSRTPSLKSTKSSGTTPPSMLDTTKSDTIDLTIAINGFLNIRPRQVAKSGPAPGMMPDLIVTYMAQKYKGPPTDAVLDLKYFKNIKTLFEQNAIYAQRASRYREAQTWRMVAFQVEKDLRVRTLANRQKRLSLKSKADVPIIAAGLSFASRSQSAASLRSLLLLSPAPSTHISRTKSPLTSIPRLPHPLRPMDSTSNVTTPLAQPVKGAKSDALTMHHGDADVTADLQLPPSVLSIPELSGSRMDQQQSAGDAVARPAREVPGIYPATMNEDNRAVTDDNRIKPPPFHRHVSSESFMFSMSSDSDSKASRSGSSLNQSEVGSLSEPLLPTKGSTKHSHDLTLDAHSYTSSGESDSQPHIFPGSYESKPVVLHADHDDGDSVLPVDTRDSKFLSKPLPHNEDDIQQGLIDNATDPVDLLQGPAEVLQGSEPVLSYLVYQSMTEFQRRLPVPEPSPPDDFVYEDYSTPVHIPSPMFPTAPDITASSMLRELLHWYADHGDSRMASQLYLLAISVLAPYQALPTNALSIPADGSAAEGLFEHLTGDILNMSPDRATEIISTYHASLKAIDLDPGQIESFLSSYHELLVAKGLSNTAAILRKQCYPAFPAVYEQAFIGTEIGLLCGECHNPIMNSVNRRICDTCNARQDSCSICTCEDSPFGPYIPKKKPKEMDLDMWGSTPASAPGVPPGPSLWASCPVCNHGAHLACISTWFADWETNGVCPTQGCLCECGRGGIKEDPVQEEKVVKGRTVRFADD